MRVLVVVVSLIRFIIIFIIINYFHLQDTEKPRPV